MIYENFILNRGAKATKPASLLELYEEKPHQKPESFSSGKIDAISLQNPCPKCQGEFDRIGAGRKPHESSLNCADCRKFLGWLDSDTLAVLLKGKRGGKS